MRSQPLHNDEAAILARAIDFDQSTFSDEAAKALVGLDFGQSDKTRMDYLAGKARAGNLTVKEEAEIETYSRVGSLISILKSKARMRLRNQKSNGAKKR